MPEDYSMYGGEEYNIPQPRKIKINVQSNNPCTITIRHTSDELAIIEACDTVKEFLLAKNKNFLANLQIHLIRMASALQSL